METKSVYVFSPLNSNWDRFYYTIQAVTWHIQAQKKNAHMTGQNNLIKINTRFRNRCGIKSVFTRPCSRWKRSVKVSKIAARISEIPNGRDSASALLFSSHLFYKSSRADAINIPPTSLNDEHSGWMQSSPGYDMGFSFRCLEWFRVFLAFAIFGTISHYCGTLHLACSQT